MSVELVKVSSSFAALSADNPTRRLPRAPNRLRPGAFTNAFDARTLFYDCFRHVDGQRVLLVGPPPLNLRSALATASYVARPGGEVLHARFFPSLSTMVTELRGAPTDASAVEITVAGETFVLRIESNFAGALRGKRLLFSINRDNDLEWIREWATFHAKVHGTDAVILYDNGSTRYEQGELLEVLGTVPGLSFAAVPRWTQSFGPIDPAVRANPFWSRFLQIGSMSAVLRRFGELAYGLLDCDIDELAGTGSGRSIYDLAKQSRGGLVAFRGIWVEATAAGRRHRDYVMRLADPAASVCRQRKWALDPSRSWVRRLSVHPYWHWVEGRPFFSKSMPKDALYWHFKGINTNWKQHRNRTPEAGLAVEPDTILQSRFKELPA
jgi:hypothetical protein